MCDLFSSSLYVTDPYRAWKLSWVAAIQHTLFTAILDCNVQQ